MFFNGKKKFKLSYLFCVCVVLRRFIKVDHDDSSGACWKTAWGLLPAMVRPYSGPTLWSVLTSWEAHHHHWCFVLLACLTYVDFNCLKFQKHLYKPCNSIEDPSEWYWSQPSYRALLRWHVESILHYKGLWWFLISCVWRGEKDILEDSGTDSSIDISSFTGLGCCGILCV